eukprot:5564588-Pyramimonas_sp.AAC.1
MGRRRRSHIRASRLTWRSSEIGVIGGGPVYRQEANDDPAALNTSELFLFHVRQVEQGWARWV